MQLSEIDLIFLKRTRELAQNGLGTTYPNPLVGCVIVYDNKIIGEGFHQRAGQAHAEILAINEVEDKSLLQNTTLYVSLEPCNHHGKTPPCTDAILENKIPRVVIDEVDLNPVVHHSGINRLRENGVQVDIYKEYPDYRNSINKRFFCYHQNKRPYIILKWAKSADGFIDGNEEKPIPITNSLSKQLSHKWRAEEMAILVGNQTLIKDNPQLSVREWYGDDIIKFAIDKDLKAQNSELFKDHNHFIFNDLQSDEHKIQLDFSTEILPQMMQKMYDLEIQSLIVEGGAKTFQSFKDQNLWDEARVFTNPNMKILDGVLAPKLKNAISTKPQFIGNDILEVFYNE